VRALERGPIAAETGRDLYGEADRGVGYDGRGLLDLLMSPIFEDYHRTVVGYHGTKRATAEAIVALRAPFKASSNDDDWLGHGIYFWEYAPQRAWEWARQRHGSNDIAVLGSMIRLGNCLDLLEPSNGMRMHQLHDQMVADLRDAGRPVPKNVLAKKRLDCAVFEYSASVFEEQGEDIDSVRAVYVPTSSKARLWASSWLCHETHVQLCIRNPRCILGTWLLQPVKE